MRSPRSRLRSAGTIGSVAGSEVRVIGLFLGVPIAGLIWFFLRYGVGGFYVISPNERAVLTTFGRAQRQRPVSVRQRNVLLKVDLDAPEVVGVQVLIRVAREPGAVVPAGDRRQCREMIKKKQRTLEMFHPIGGPAGARIIADDAEGQGAPNQQKPETRERLPRPERSRQPPDVGPLPYRDSGRNARGSP